MNPVRRILGSFQFGKICVTATLLFAMYSVISCKALTGHSSLPSNRTINAQNVSRNAKNARLLFIRKVTHIIKQKAKGNALKECNTTIGKVLARFLKKYDQIVKHAAGGTIAKIRVKDFIQVNKGSTSTASTNDRKVTVQYKNGQSLTFNKITGKIHGTMNSSSSKNQNTIFSIKSNGPQVLTIQCFDTKRYIAMDKHGHIISRATPSDETLFYSQNEENHFVTLASYRYYFACPFDMFLAIRNNGFIKSPHHSAPGQDSTQLLLVPVTD